MLSPEEGMLACSRASCLVLLDSTYQNLLLALDLESSLEMLPFLPAPFPTERGWWGSNWGPEGDRERGSHVCHGQGSVWKARRETHQGLVREKPDFCTSHGAPDPA